MKQIRDTNVVIHSLCRLSDGPSDLLPQSVFTFPQGAGESTDYGSVVCQFSP